jgi:hypothetical protein
MTDDYYIQLERISPDMDQAPASPDATVGYDVLSDALVWSDEYPDSLRRRFGEFQCIRLLLRYRTTLLLGNPDEALQPYWEKARSLFPNWAGFQQDRLRLTDELRRAYDRQSAKQMNFVRRLMRLGRKTP